MLYFYFFISRKRNNSLEIIKEIFHFFVHNFTLYAASLAIIFGDGCFTGLFHALYIYVFIFSGMYITNFYGIMLRSVGSFSSIFVDCSGMVVIVINLNFERAQEKQTKLKDISSSI